MIYQYLLNSNKIIFAIIINIKLIYLLFILIKNKIHVKIYKQKLLLIACLRHNHFITLYYMNFFFFVVLNKNFI